MEESRPLVSIIVRTKDRPKLLRRALQSIASQTYRPIEVVLVNDGGCDLSSEELRVALGDISLNYVKLDKNMGRAHAGNVGIGNAKGQYIGFLDDDDVLYPDHVVALVEFLIAHEGFAAAYADSHLAKMTYNSDTDELTETDICVFFSQDFSFDLLLMENYIPLNCLLFHASTLNTAGGFDKTFDLYEDWDLLIRAAKEGPLYHIPRTTSKVHQWSDNNQITLRMRVESADRASYIQLLKKHRALITLNVMYQYFVTSGIRHGNVVKTLRDIEALRVDHIALVNQNAGLKQARASLEEDLKNIQAENTRLRNDTSELLAELTGARNYNLQLIAELAELKGSLGWKMLESYRNMKDRLFPPSSRRRDFYQMALKVVKTYRNEGVRAVYQKVQRRIRRKMEKTPELLTSPDTPPILESAGNMSCRRPVDIILPVHNGYKELKLCIESILDLTDLSYNRLIIIDDRSTDKRTSEYLRKLDTAGRNLTVLFNEANLGFVKTVNRGMAGSCNDVILLNSDTVITRYWVEKLQRTAFSRERVATVTPFSNHAYHCSIPQPLKYNFLPAGFTVASFADFINHISLRYYPEIPSGSGFCLYITRKALEEVGRFDEDLFEKGYGEETDFCLRALKAGWVNLLDDSTYIYHWGGVSFESGKNAIELEEKNRMIQRNLVKLRERHPEYEHLLTAAVERTLKPLHEYIQLRLELRNTA